MRRSPRTALVTGGNRGLGRETCRQLARGGFRVLLTGRTEAGELAARQLAAEGLDVQYRRLDVVDRSNIAEFADQLRREAIPLYALVNNAGIALDGFNATVARRTLEVNFFGALHVTEALLSRISDGGNIVMVSSGIGELSGLAPALRERFMDPQLGREGLLELMRSFIRDVESGRHAAAGWPSSAYRVSKVGLNALTRILARELAKRRIRVNAVCPGWVRTDMGGRHAQRTVEEGAASIVWAAALDDGPSGGFFRDGKPIPW
ncbi:MAG TPA: SDR family oxidoreductase [Myxococcaceae bacterium]|nr:SDR family oxidoreductase [Myxococcaceae bacterium]